MEQQVHHLAVALAALLHDVGKVGQRAHGELEGLSASSRGLAEYLCPVSQFGGRTHLHVLYTNEFCERILGPHLPRAFSVSEICNLAAYHHRPAKGTQQETVTAADHISAALERGAPAGTVGRGDFRRVLLAPVSGHILTESNPPTWQVIDLESFSKQTAFPHVQTELVDQQPAYRRIWDGLCARASKLELDDPIGYINTLLYLFEDHLWAVPSATNVERPDVCLYDHLKSTAAIAGCLHITQNAAEPFLLVSGDVGGIQAHIFAVRGGAKGFARALRGRSFLVSALSDLTAMGILSDLKLPLTNMLMSVGGRFVLLLPNSPKVVAIVEARLRRTQEWILDRQQGHLRFNMAWQALSEQGLRSDFPAAMQELSERLVDAKLTGMEPLRSSGSWNVDRWMLSGLSAANPEVCTSCGTRAVENAGGSGEDRLCENCLTDREIGRDLVKSTAIIANLDQAALDHGLYHVAGEEFAFPKDVPKHLDHVGTLLEFLPADTGAAHDGRFNRARFRILRNVYVPKDDRDDSILEFGAIAARSEGIPYLGYLKADVDDLGFIFSRGLNPAHPGPGDRTSVSRVVGLSRALEFFFAGHLSKLLRTEFPLTYTVFSGGDDLLLIGPWDRMLTLAARIRADFRLYTCSNPAWGMSAGFALGKPKTPISHVLRELNRNLLSSKRCPGKDSITALGYTMTWTEFDKALGDGERLTGWLRDGTLNSSKLHRLHGYALRLAEFRSTGDTSLLRTIPMMIHDISRNWGDDSVQEREAKRWVQDFTNPDYPELHLLGFICQYAMNRTRKGSDQDGHV